MDSHSGLFWISHPKRIRGHFSGNNMFSAPLTLRALKIASAGKTGSFNKAIGLFKPPRSTHASNSMSHPAVNRSFRGNFSSCANSHPLFYCRNAARFQLAIHKNGTAPAATCFAGSKQIPFPRKFTQFITAHLKSIFNGDLLRNRENRSIYCN